MTVGEDIYTELSNDVYLTNFVGTRIYPNFIKLGATYPAVSYILVTEIPQIGLIGESGLSNYTYQFDCWAKTYSEAHEISGVLIDAVNGSPLFKANRNSTQDFFDPEYGIHRVSVDFSIWQ